MSEQKQQPIRSNERVQQRYASGDNPVIVSDAGLLAFILDPSMSTDSNVDRVALSVRHGARDMFSFGSVASNAHANSVGVALTAGDAADSSGDPTFLSIQTAGIDATPDASLRMVERMRIGPGNRVVLPEGSELDALGNATIHEDLMVHGTIYASKYLNLVDDISSTSIFLPPTANALRGAFTSLSNFISTSLSQTPSSTITSTSTSTPTLTCTSGTSGTSGDAFAIPSIVCTDLRVGGTVTAAAYCNLAHDHTVSDPRRPPSAAALHATYTHLSNYVTLKLDAAQWSHHLHWGEVASNSSSSGSGYMPLPSEFPVTTFQGDYWLKTAGDDTGRLLFPALGTQMPTQFGAVPAADPSLDAFRWVSYDAGASPETATHMSLTHGGELTIASATTPEVTCMLSGQAIRLPASNSEVVLGGSLSVEGDTRLKGAVAVEGDVSCEGDMVVSGTIVASNLTVEGGFTFDFARTDVYSNLPVASESNAGIVTLGSGGDASNVAAVTAYVAAVERKSSEMSDMTHVLMGEAFSAAHAAQATATHASNILSDTLAGREQTFVRTYTDATIVDAIDLTNDSGVAIKLAATSDDGPVRGSLTLTESELVLSGPGPSSIKLGNQGGVSIERTTVAGGSGSSSGSSVIPTVDAGTASTWVDAALGVAYTATASSVFDAGAEYALPQRAFQPQGAETSWMSERAMYSDSNGYPVVSVAAETVFSVGSDGGSATVAGEWLQLDLLTDSAPPTPTGVYATHFRLAVSDLNHVPDDFVLLGRSEDDGDAWHVIGARSMYVSQADALVAADPETGIAYGLGSYWTQRRIHSIRLVVTRIREVGGGDFGYFSSTVQVGRLSLEGASFFSPTPMRVFSVLNGDAMVVDLEGRVGFGLGSNALPLAPLHVHSSGSEATAAPAIMVSSRNANDPVFQVVVETRSNPDPTQASTTTTTLQTGTSDWFAIRIGDSSGEDAIAVDPVACAVSVCGAPVGGSTDVRFGVSGNTHIHEGGIVVDGDITTSGGALFVQDTRVIDRKYAKPDSFINGARFHVFPYDGSNMLREGYVGDLTSLSLGTAGLMLIGNSSNPAANMSATRVEDDGGATGRDLLRQATHVRWEGMLVCVHPEPNVRLEAVTEAAPVRVVANDAVVIEWFGTSNLPAPDFLDPKGSDPNAGHVVLTDALNDVAVDLHDYFVDDASDFVPWTSSRDTLTFSVVDDPASYVVGSSNAVVYMRGKYAATSNLTVTVRASSTASGLSTDAAIPLNDLPPQNPTIAHVLGVLDRPASSTEYDLMVHFLDATLPASGLVFSLDTPSDSNAIWASAASITGSTLTIAPDFRAARYSVAVRATSSAYPESTTVGELVVTEKWPVEAALAASLGSVTLSDNFTPADFTIDPDGQPYFTDLAGQGLVFTLESDVPGAAALTASGSRGYAHLEDATWDRYEAFSGTARAPTRDFGYVPPPLPGSNESPAFSNEAPYWQAATAEQQVLTVLGDYRDATYDVVLVATSVAYPQNVSARRVLTVTEPPAPPPIVLDAAIGPVTLDATTTEWTTDLRSRFQDMSLRGMSFGFSSDGNEYASAAIDPDGYTLRITGAHRGAEYTVGVVGVSEPYGTESLAPLEIRVIESDPPPVAIETAEAAAAAAVRVGANRDDNTPLRLPLYSLIEARGPLVFSLLSVSPTNYDSAYVDVGENDLVLDGVNGSSLAYTVHLRATDAYSQSIDFDVTVDNVLPPTPKAPGTKTLLMPAVPGIPLVVNNLPLLFDTTAGVPIARYTVQSDPCGCASYDSVLNRITVTSAPVVLQVRAIDDLAQSSEPYVINVPV